MFSAGSGETGGGTGVLFAPGYVLTAAHNVFIAGEWATKVGFSLAQCGEICKPYGSVSVSDIWVPTGYTEFESAVPGAPTTPELIRYKSFDFALLKLGSDLTTWAVEAAPPPSTLPTFAVSPDMNFGAIDVRATGYACGREPPSMDLGMCRIDLWPYTTSAEARVLELVMQAEGTGTLRADVEATARMSGGPVWINFLGVPVQIGVLIGSNCMDDGANWAAALTDTALAWIQVAIFSGSHPSLVHRTPGAGFYPDGGYGSGFAEFGECDQL